MNLDTIGSLLSMIGLAALIIFIRGRGNKAPSEETQEVIDDLTDRLEDHAREKRDDEIADARADADADRRLPLADRARAALARARRVLGSRR